MIRSFVDEATARLVKRVREFVNIERVALRNLEMIKAALVLKDLRVPPGNRFEALKGDRVGQHSIWINDQFRICFVWKVDGAYDVEICNYH